MYYSIRPLKRLLLPIKFLHKKKVGRFAPRMRLNAPDRPTVVRRSSHPAFSLPPKALPALAEWGPANRRGPSTERTVSNILALKIRSILLCDFSVISTPKSLPNGPQICIKSDSGATFFSNAFSTRFRSDF